MVTDRGEEIARNFDYFQGVVAGLLADRRGQHALLRDAKILGYYVSPVQALAAGHEKFADGIFSVQAVTDQPFDLGFLSHGANDRATA